MPTKTTKWTPYICRGLICECFMGTALRHSGHHCHLGLQISSVSNKKVELIKSWGPPLTNAWLHVIDHAGWDALIRESNGSVRSDENRDWNFHMNYISTAHNDLYSYHDSLPTYSLNLLVAAVNSLGERLGSSWTGLPVYRPVFVSRLLVSVHLAVYYHLMTKEPWFDSLTRPDAQFLKDNLLANQRWASCGHITDRCCFHRHAFCITLL